jgi:ABC-2 type transport system ATP-binding protein
MARAAASVSVRHVTHRYPGADRDALSDATFEVEPGQRLGLLGPNGAGKSTLMRLLCGFLPLSDRPRTAIEVAGLDVRTHSRRVRSSVGYMPEQVPLYHELRVHEHLRFRARVKGVPWRRRRAEVQRVAELTAIADVLDTPIGQLSRGYRQRVGLSDALLGEPPLVVLDEPTVGLDPNQVREVRAMLKALGGAQTLVFSSHILAEVEMLCDRVVILSHGAVVADESIAAATTATRVHATLHCGREAAQRIVAAAWRSFDLPAGSARLEALGDDRIEATLDLAAGAPSKATVAPEELLGAIGAACVHESVALSRLAAGTTRLEERFAEVTGAARAAGETPQPVAPVQDARDG